MPDWELDLSLYTPRQAESITGIKMVRQRDLRRHGYLPKQDGVAAFTIVELAKMMVLSSMMHQGIGPAKSIGIAEISAVGIVKWALSEPTAWAGMDLAKWSYPFEQTPQDKAAWLSRVFSSGRAFEGEPLWRVTPGRFLILFADSQEFWTNSVDQELEEIEPTDPRLAGPIMVLDLKSMAATLLKKAELPLAHVVSNNEAQP